MIAAISSYLDMTSDKEPIKVAIANMLPICMILLYFRVCSVTDKTPPPVITYLAYKVLYVKTVRDNPLVIVRRKHPYK